MMITPTPRAMSPQDIVRIYVPPAPPEEIPISITQLTNQQQRRSLSASNQSISTTGNRPSSQLNGSRDHLHHNHRRSGVSPTPSKSNLSSVGNGDATPRRRSLHRSEEELNSLMLQMYSQFDPSKSTSSSRRGSLSRKSPSSLMLHEEHNRLMMECSHIPAGSRRRSSSEQFASSENVSSSLRHAMSPDRKVHMTSFEQLAQKRDRMIKSDIMPSSQDSLSRELWGGVSSSQYGSESNIEYQPLRRTSLPKNGDSVQVVHGGGNDVIDAYPTTVKPYSRYYSGNVNNDDEDDDEDFRNRSKSSDGSSSSPNSKSVVSTPVNDSNPLISDKLRIEDYGDHTSSVHSTSHNPPRSRIPQIASPPSSSYSRKSSFNSNSSPSSMSKTSKIPLFHKAPSPTDETEFDEPVSPRFYSSTAKRQRQQIPPLVDQRRQIPPPSSGNFADLDSRIAAPLGGVYQFTTRSNSSHHQQQRTSAAVGSGLMSGSSGPMSTNRPIESGLRKPTDMNKIRIKINQNQKN